MLLFFFFSFFFENVLLNFCIEKQLRCKKNYNLKEIHFFLRWTNDQMATMSKEDLQKQNKKRYIGWHQPKYFDVWLEPPNMSMTSRV